MAISFQCRRIRIQSQPLFINPFQDRTTQQAVNEVEWLNSGLFCCEILEQQGVSVCPSPSSALRRRVCARPTDVGVLAQVFCVCVSQFLPYYCLCAAFRLRFQLCCWATPSFPAPWSHFFFHSRREGRRSGTLCPDLRSLVYYRSKRVWATSQKLKPKHIPDHL